MSALSFRFRPRRPVLATASIFFGAGLAVPSVIAGLWLWAAVGAMGLLAGAVYLASPAWRTEIRVTSDHLEVLSGGVQRFALPWTEVERVVAAPSNHTAFIAGPTSECSILLPGRGAKAPYKIERQAQLFAFVLEHVDKAVVVEVERLSDTEKQEPDS